MILEVENDFDLVICETIARGIDSMKIRMRDDIAEEFLEILEDAMDAYEYETKEC